MYAADAPAWLAIDASTGTVTGTPPSGTTSFAYSVIASNPAGTATAGPYEVTVTAKAPKADLTAALSRRAKLIKGGTGVCSLSVVNKGPQTASAVQIVVTLKNTRLAEVSCTGGCTKVASGTYGWQLASLAAGTSADFTITVAAKRTGSGLILLQASSATTDPHPFNNAATRQISVKS